jgi:hypothetical protein
MFSVIDPLPLGPILSYTGTYGIASGIYTASATNHQLICCVSGLTQ